MNLARRAAMCGLSRWRTQHPPLRSVARALARCAARCPRCGATWCDLPQLGAAIKTDYIDGLVTIDERMLIIIDIEKLATMEEIVSLGKPLETVT